MHRKLKMKEKIFFASIGGIMFSSCGGKLDSLENNSSSCAMAIDEKSWTKTTSPNISLFPDDKLYYSVNASSYNCSNIITGSKDIKVTLNLKSSINTVGLGERMVFVSLTSDNLSSSQVHVAKDVSANFKTGRVYKAVIDSSRDLSWKPPFDKLHHFTVKFMIPNAIESTLQHYPKGNITLETK
jgi:hypothetical protein